MYPSVTPSFLIISTLLVAMLNLVTPFISNSDNNTRNSLLITISSFFFVNILIIDWLFLKGVRANLSITIFSNFAIGLHLEALSLIFLTLLSFLWICALIYTTKYLAINNIDNSSRFLFFINLSVLSGGMVALSSNLFTMFIFYEILTLSTAPLIGHSGGDKVMAGVYKYLKILMISGILLFLPAIIIIYAKAGHGDFTSQGFIEHYFSKNQTIILLLMFIFGTSKAALYPLHQWLPAAMVAHYPVSALLHAVVVVKTGLFCIYKILIYIFGLKYLHSIFAEFNWIIFLPIITIFYSSFKALTSDNIKKILAYSTINQLGIALLSSFMFTSKSIGAAILHLSSHSFTKICLFYGMGSIYSLKKTNQISDLINAGKEMPKTSFMVCIASLSLIGIPPFGGFISKFYIMLAAAEQNQILVMGVLALSTLFSALYLAKLVIFIYKPVNCHSREKGNLEPRLCRDDMKISENKLPNSMMLSLIICSCCIILFYFIQIFIKKFFIFIY
ncbi:proton-conducting transporter transmembrane domain-containing protein [Rickettsia endosymbiont of Oedothorax gibbosus]|uniref:proton-conducting transporter transmembrane domain-containing protein n=1 Tax=Rickettsia endosymbiont of Oedothorax gibbosus TaxID=931099 RepID=UPI0020253B49|nr:proton-conducting transporter membrane subunit [Rickettsia endosymbiont of Oedothorax gibbosus]